MEYRTFLSWVHPEDRLRVDRLVQETLAPGGTGTFAVEYRALPLENQEERG
jgi:hypothetical protein